MSSPRSPSNCTKKDFRDEAAILLVTGYVMDAWYTHLPWHATNLSAIDCVIEVLCVCERWTLLHFEIRVLELLIRCPDIHQLVYPLPGHLYLAI